MHVEQGKLQLPHHVHTDQEIFRRDHFVEQRAGQGFAGVHVAGHVLQHVPFPAEIFHELARQFHRIPLDAVNARHAQFFDLRQQMMQAVAEFVEQRDHFVVGEQRGLAADGRGKITVQVSHGRLYAAADAPPCDGVVHPRAAALGFAGVHVEVKLADQFAGAIADVKKLNRLVPQRRLAGLNVQTVERIDHAEHAGQHLRLGEILFDLLLGKTKAFAAQFLRYVAHIPGLQIV